MRSLFLFLVFFVSVLSSWEFIDKKGDVVTLEWVKEIDLIQEEEVFAQAFLTAYQDFSEETLGVKNKESFLHEAFEDMHQEFLSGKQHLVIAKIEGKTVGFAGFEATETPHEMYITQLAVSPEYWQRGIGEECVFSILNLFKDTNHLVTITRGINKKAQQFYHRLGFTECIYMHTGYNPQKYVGYEWINNSDFP